MVMPTVVVVRGFRVRVHFNEDGDPPHVHVFKGGREYRVHLLDDGAALLTAGGRENCTAAEARVAVEIVAAHLIECWIEWKTWHP